MKMFAKKCAVWGRRWQQWRAQQKVGVAEVGEEEAEAKAEEEEDTQQIELELPDLRSLRSRKSHKL